MSDFTGLAIAGRVATANDPDWDEARQAWNLAADQRPYVAPVARQRRDGTWVNRYTASKEDDPLVATCFAAGAIANCRVLMEQRP